jgi:hypothetical protein
MRDGFPSGCEVILEEMLSVVVDNDLPVAILLLIPNLDSISVYVLLLNPTYLGDPATR